MSRHCVALRRPVLWLIVSPAAGKIIAMRLALLTGLTVSFSAMTFIPVVAQTPYHLPMSCRLYAQLDRVCRCPGRTNYLRSYGLKYCERFRSAVGWTPDGAIWRDQTLICLQNELKRLAPEYIDKCDCEGLRREAFDTHAYCYTQHVSSFCTLLPADVNKIYGIVDLSDLRSSQGFRQGLAIFWNCVTGKFLRGD
jgi:hypothetical protein